MGVVYKARDPLIDRVVAIKTVGLGLSNAETEAYERRFFREAKSAGRLNHPNVVTIHDVGKHRGHRVHRDGVPRRTLVARDPRFRRRAAAGAHRRHRRAGCRRARVRAPARGRASRREAREHHGARQRRGEDHRFRRRAAAHRDAHAGRQRVRLAALHVARAGDGPHGRRALRHLLAGRRALRDADRPAALLRRGSQQHPHAGAARPDARAQQPQPLAAARVRPHRREGAREGSRRPAVRMRRKWRRTCAILPVSSCLRAARPGPRCRRSSIRRSGNLRRRSPSTCPRPRRRRCARSPHPWPSCRTRRAFRASSGC